MVFSSVIFLFFFLPLVLLTVPIKSIRLRNFFLLLFSLVFYAWGEGFLVGLLLVSIAINYFSGLLISTRSGVRKRWYLGLGIGINLLLLAYFKYADFLLNILTDLGWRGSESNLNITLPIGISFFTFQGISYLIDVYRKDGEVQKNPLELALYISLFPQLIAGPIIRYRDIALELKKRRISLDDFSAGLTRFIQGLAKKVIVANNLAVIADEVFKTAPVELPFSMAWLGLICYTFQIYFDFSGYSDMAIGLGRIFGFHFKENFNFPYLARSIREFWRRWHISLSNWFRDYLYIPLGGNRLGKARTYLNLITVFFLTGLWHGASWNFVLWGLFHGFFLVAERNLSFRLPAFLKQLYCLIVVLFAWVLFRSDTITYAFDFYKALFGLSEGSNYYPVLFLDGYHICVLIFAVLSMIPVSEKIYKQLENTIQLNYLQETIRIASFLLLFVCTIMELGGGSYNPFIYFRF